MAGCRQDLPPSSVLRNGWPHTLADACGSRQHRRGLYARPAAAVNRVSRLEVASDRTASWRGVKHRLAAATSRPVPSRTQAASVAPRLSSLFAPRSSLFPSAQGLFASTSSLFVSTSNCSASAQRPVDSASSLSASSPSHPDTLSNGFAWTASLSGSSSSRFSSWSTRQAPCGRQGVWMPDQGVDRTATASQPRPGVALWQCHGFRDQSGAGAILGCLPSVAWYSRTSASAPSGRAK